MYQSIPFLLAHISKYDKEFKLDSFCRIAPTSYRDLTLSNPIESNYCWRNAFHLPCKQVIYGPWREPVQFHDNIIKMDTFSALLALCAGNASVAGEIPAQRPVTRSFDVFFDLPLDKQLSKQSWGWWFKTPSRSSWRHCNVSSTTLIPDVTSFRNIEQGTAVSLPSTLQNITDIFQCILMNVLYFASNSTEINRQAVSKFKPLTAKYINPIYSHRAGCPVLFWFCLQTNHFGDKTLQTDFAVNVRHMINVWSWGCKAVDDSIESEYFLKWKPHLWHLVLNGGLFDAKSLSTPIVSR